MPAEPTMNFYETCSSVVFDMQQRHERKNVGL